ncbi:MAG: carbohydrate porin [Alphaproteobacteria bacterium]|nr:carbohydrate porin [Alphaproteobacteria bacterium]
MITRSLLAFALLAGPAVAEEAATDAKAFNWSASSRLDVIGPVAGLDQGKRGYLVEESSLIGDLDLEKAIGWRGGSLHGWLGVDNSEAPSRLRVFELFLEQSIPGADIDVRAGLIGLDSSFYVTESSGLLVNPAFGAPSALAATGSNGPSIYPSSSLALQTTWRPFETVYAQIGAFNADAGTIGDPDGADTSFDSGALIIAETGVTQDGKLAIGAWTYTDKVDDIREVDAKGDPKRRTARGAYILAERPLNDQDGARATTTFLRIGVSDGQTTEITGDAQAGVAVNRVLTSRPDSQFAAGVRYTRLSDNAIQIARDAGEDLERGEIGMELSYSDNVLPWLAVQPNLQVIADPGGRTDKSIWVAGLRLTASFSGAF